MRIVVNELVALEAGKVERVPLSAAHNADTGLVEQECLGGMTYYGR